MAAQDVAKATTVAVQETVNENWIEAPGASVDKVVYQLKDSKLGFNPSLTFTSKTGAAMYNSTLGKQIESGYRLPSPRSTNIEISLDDIITFAVENDGVISSSMDALKLAPYKASLNVIVPDSAEITQDIIENIMQLFMGVLTQNSTWDGIFQLLNKYPNYLSSKEGEA